MRGSTRQVRMMLEAQAAAAGCRGLVVVVMGQYKQYRQPPPVVVSSVQRAAAGGSPWSMQTVVTCLPLQAAPPGLARRLCNQVAHT